MPILDISGADPRIDGRQSERALAIRRGVIRHFQEQGVQLLSELPLITGRRADLIGIDRNGRISIVEIKSSVADLRADSKWPDYLAFCDHFYFATHPEVPIDIFPEVEGLIVADPYGAEILRHSTERKLAAATRRALTIRFARAAAGRLDRVLVHCERFGETIPIGFSVDDDHEDIS